MDFDWGHPDLLPNIVVHPSGQAFTFDSFGPKNGGHGTLVAGTLCAVGNNTMGVVGVAWKCSLSLYDVSAWKFGILNTPHIGAVKLADAMKKAVDGGAQVVNISLGMVEANCGQPSRPVCSSDAIALVLAAENNAIIEPAIEYSELNADPSKRDVLWVIAAGNERRSVVLQSPAGLVVRHPNRIIAVAAANIPNGTAVGQSVPLLAESNFGSLVDVAAPNPVTTISPRTCDRNTNVCDDSFFVATAEANGTSVAAPQVAGVAALVLSKHSTKTVGQVKKCITDAGSATVINRGFKVIDAAKAVKCELVEQVLQPGPLDSKDIWTTSYYSFLSGPSRGPGGGLNDEWLRVGGWGDYYVSLLEFNLTGLPAVATSARIELHMPQIVGLGATGMDLYRTTTPWDWRTQGTGEDRARLWWADRPAAALVTPGLSVPQVGQWYSIDITGLYNGWKSGAYPNYGVQLWPRRIDQHWSVFYSSEYVGDPTLRPKLVVVP